MSRKEKSNKDRAGTILSKGIIIFTWTLLFCLVSLIVWELLLRKKNTRAIQKWRAKRPYYAYLTKAYEPFIVQHINPHYLFFFPFDLNERKKINNEVCSVDDDGFRGLGPEHAGSRKLAFILGGSANFGHFASSDFTTITGYLNKIQQEYFFVNAGVPSWNSTQNLYRLIYQILEYEPALVIAYGGFNDAIIMLAHHSHGLPYPPGTPESFYQLYALVGDISAGKLKPSAITPWHKRYFPCLSRKFRHHFIPEDKQASQVEPISEELIELHAKKYVYNLKLMNILASAQGTRFIGIFQPILILHENLPAKKLKRYRDKKHYKQFHKLAFENHEDSFEYLDFSNIFDLHYKKIPYYDYRDDISDEMVFFDHVHLSDTGNRFIASEIYKYL